MVYLGPLEGLGDGLRTLRKRRGLLQREVAEAIKTDVSSVSAWENDGNITAESLERLLTLYQATLMDLAELLPASKAGRAGGGGRTLDGDTIRRELDDALRRAGVLPPKKEDDGEKSSRRRDLSGLPLGF